jgi:hypothetical protein
VLQSRICSGRGARDAGLHHLTPYIRTVSGGREPSLQTTDFDGEPIGRGLRPSIASPGDLARMLSALGREQDIPNLIMMRRLIELEHELHRGLSTEH